MTTNNTLLEDLVSRVLDVLGRVLPASTLDKLGEQIRPAINAVLAPFQVVRREDFEGYLAQLQRLEDEVDGLRQQLDEQRNSRTGSGA